MVMFYHLTASSAEDTARILLVRALGMGWRVMIRGTGAGAAQMKRLDERLWMGPTEDFLPHGLEGGPFDTEQPVLIGRGPITNGAKALMLIDGAEPLAGEVAMMERTFVLFDGADADGLATARIRWTELTAQGHAAQYWAEDAGKWIKKAEKPAQLAGGSF